MSNSTNLTNKDIDDRNELISSVSHYDIFLHLRPNNYSGKVLISFNFNQSIQDSSHQKLIIDFRGSTVHSVSIATDQKLTDETENNNNNNIIPYYFKHGKIELRVSDVVKSQIEKEQKELKVLISFSNEYSRHKAEGIVKYKDEEDNNFIYCQGEVACTCSIFPCIDQLNFRSLYTITVQHPKEWNVSSQKKIQKSDDEVISYFPCVDIAFPTYLFGLYAGQMERYTEIYTEAIQLNIYCRKEMKEILIQNVNEYFKLIKFALKYMEDYTNVKYYLDKFDVFFCPHYTDYGMETLGCISLDEDEFLDDEGEGFNQYDKMEMIEILFHEIAHQWFGNYVSIKWWNDLFIKEGFANFFGSKILEEYYNKTDSIYFLTELRQLETLEEDLNSNKCLIHNRLAYKDYVSMLNHDDVTYQKSQSLFLLLENKLYGKECFQNVVKKICNDYKHKSIDTNDFLSYLNDSISRKYLTTQGYYYIQGQKLNKFNKKGTISLDMAEINQMQLEFYSINKVSLIVTLHSLQEINKLNSKEYVHILNTCDNHMIYHSIDEATLHFIDQNNLIQSFDEKLRVSIWKSLLFLCEQDEWSNFLNVFFIKNILSESNDALFYQIVGEYFEYADSFSSDEYKSFVELLNQEMTQKRKTLLIENFVEYIENIEILILIQNKYLVQMNNEIKGIKKLLQDKIDRKRNLKQ